MFLKDVGIVSQTIMLGAAERGLGGCMFGSGNPDRIREALGLPGHITPSLVLALGKPDETVVLEDIPADGKRSEERFFAWRLVLVRVPGIETRAACAPTERKSNLNYTIGLRRVQLIRPAFYAKDL
jgi:hypothetical protein